MRDRCWSAIGAELTHTDAVGRAHAATVALTTRPLRHLPGGIPSPICVEQKPQEHPERRQRTLF